MPSWVKAQIFPLRSDVTLEQVESSLRWYHDRGMIARYTSKGRPYFQVGNWHKYQGKTEREADSPYPGLENNSRKEKKEDKDTYIDIDASRNTNSRVSQELVKSNTHTYNNRYELPREATPFSDHVDARAEMVSAIAGVVKTTLAPGINENEFEQVAEALIRDGMTPEQVGSFGKWWKRNGHYEGKPALKSLLGEIKNVVVKQEEDFGDF